MKRVATFAAFFAALLALPLAISSDYVMHILVVWLIFSIVALSLNVVIGYVGELSLGHAAFFGLGAYASAMATVYLHWPTLAGLLLAIAFAGLVGALVGALSLRIEGPQFAILTFGFSGIIYTIINSWIDFTNGPLGIARIPRPELLGIPVGTTAFGYYYLALATLGLALLFVGAVMSSRIGRAFLSIRENPALAASIGINVFAYKLLAFTLATAMGGVGGSLYAHYIGIITPELMSPFYMIAFIVMVVIGGKGTLAGPVVGALFYVVMLEALRVVDSLRLVVFALALILVVVFMPGGLVSFLDRLRGRA